MIQYIKPELDSQINRENLPYTKRPIDRFGVLLRPVFFQLLSATVRQSKIPTSLPPTAPFPPSKTCRFLSKKREKQRQTISRDMTSNGTAEVVEVNISLDRVEKQLVPCLRLIVSPP